MVVPTKTLLGLIFDLHCCPIMAERRAPGESPFYSVQRFSMLPPNFEQVNDGNKTLFIRLMTWRC
jgi:hypothetical protein